MNFRLRAAAVLLLLLVADLQVRAEPAQNLLIATFDGLRSQEVFAGADAALFAPAANAPTAVEVLVAAKAKFGSGIAEARRETLLPFIWGDVATKGRIYGDPSKGSPCRVENGRNYSYPGYNELLTGAPNPNIDSNEKFDNPNINVLEWIGKLPGFQGKVAAFCSWDVFPYILNAKRSGLAVNAGWQGIADLPDAGASAEIKTIAAETPHLWPAVRFDWLTFRAAEDCLRTSHPRVLYVAFGETDDWGHEGRYDLYLDAAHRTDNYIRRLWETMQSMPQYADKTALLIATDHGRGDTAANWRNHQYDVPTSDRVWIGLLGAGIAAKGVASSMPTRQSQFAATAAALLGLDFTASRQGISGPIARFPDQ